MNNPSPSSSSSSSDSELVKNPKFDFKSADIGVKTATSPTFGAVTPDRPGFGARLKSFFSRIGAFFHKIGVKLKVYIFRPLFSGWRKFVTLGVLVLLIAGTALGILFLSRQGITPIDTENYVVESIDAAVKGYESNKDDNRREKMLKQMEYLVSKSEKEQPYIKAVDTRWSVAITLENLSMPEDALSFVLDLKEDKMTIIQKENFYHKILSLARKSGRSSIVDEYAKKLKSLPENLE